MNTDGWRLSCWLLSAWACGQRLSILTSFFILEFSFCQKTTLQESWPMFSTYTQRTMINIIKQGIWLKKIILKINIRHAYCGLCSYFLRWRSCDFSAFGVTDPGMSIFHLIPWLWLHPRSKSCDGPDWSPVGDFISHGALPVHKLTGITQWEGE